MGLRSHDNGTAPLLTYVGKSKGLLRRILQGKRSTTIMGIRRLNDSPEGERRLICESPSLVINATNLEEAAEPGLGGEGRARARRRQRVSVGDQHRAGQEGFNYQRAASRGVSPRSSDLGGLG